MAFHWLKIFVRCYATVRMDFTNTFGEVTRGPDNYLFILGYAGWGPGQLEQELVKNGWLTVPSNDDIIFHTSDDSKWKAAALQLGIDIEIFEDVIGSA